MRSSGFRKIEGRNILAGKFKRRVNTDKQAIDVKRRQARCKALCDSFIMIYFRLFNF